MGGRMMARKIAKKHKAPETGPFAGLTFAVYARKSDEDARQEDHKSTARQVEHARRYVEARGGEVLEEHVYADEVSGAEFKARPGLLMVSPLSRTGRFGPTVWLAARLKRPSCAA